MRYHLECQSTADGTMMYRIFEYDSQIALQAGEISDNKLPFHLFTYEQDFKVYEENPQKLNELTAVYEKIAEKLNVCKKNDIIDAYTKSMVVDMSKKVLEHLAMKYSNVKKKVGAIMGGKILDYPAKTYKREGRQEHLVEQVQKKLEKGKSIEEIADALEESIETIQNIIDSLQ